MNFLIYKIGVLIFQLTFEVGSQDFLQIYNHLYNSP